MGIVKRTELLTCSERWSVNGVGAIGLDREHPRLKNRPEQHIGASIIEELGNKELSRSLGTNSGSRK
jgi:hypothetical protein